MRHGKNEIGAQNLLPIKIGEDNGTNFVNSGDEFEKIRSRVKRTVFHGAFPHQKMGWKFNFKVRLILLTIEGEVFEIAKSTILNLEHEVPHFTRFSGTVCFSGKF